MDRAKLLTWGGAGLVGASAVTLAVLTLGGGGDAPPALPDEVASAPVAPSQAPGEEAPVAGPLPSGGGLGEGRGEDRGEDGDEPDEDRSGNEGADGLVPVPAETGPTDDVQPTDVPATVPREARRDRTAAAPPRVTFCFPGVIPTPDGCASRATILSFAGEPIGVEGPDGIEPLTVTLADPDDLSAPEREVGTCDDYLALKRRGWGAMTSAGLNRDLRMNRFCGLIAMAGRAEPAARGGLTRLTYGLLETVPASDWPSLGEAAMTDPAIALGGEDERLWQVSDASQTVALRDVGAADLDGDGQSEVLVHAGVAARGGTARGGGYLIAKRTRGGMLRLEPADLYAD